MDVSLSFSTVRVVLFWPEHDRSQFGSVWALQRCSKKIKKINYIRNSEVAAWFSFRTATTLDVAPKSLQQLHQLQFSGDPKQENAGNVTPNRGGSSGQALKGRRKRQIHRNPVAKELSEVEHK